MHTLLVEDSVPYQFVCRNDLVQTHQTAKHKNRKQADDSNSDKHLSPLTTFIQFIYKHMLNS